MCKGKLLYSKAFYPFMGKVFPVAGYPGKWEEGPGFLVPRCTLGEPPGMLAASFRMWRGLPIMPGWS